MRSLNHTYAEMLASRLLAILASFGVAILTARVLGPADRGHYYYIITLAATGVQFASFGIHASNSYLIARTPVLLAQLMANSGWIALVGGVAAAAGALVFDFFVGDFAQSVISVIAVLMLAPSLLLFLYLSNMAVALNRPRTFNGLIIFNGVAAIAAALFAAYPAPSLSSFLLAAVVASLASGLLAWGLLSRGVHVPRSFDVPLFYQGISFAFRSYVATLFGFMMSRMSIGIIRQFGDFSDLGYWSVAAQISDALLILPATVSLLLFPSLVRIKGAMRWNEYRKTLFQVSFVMAALCIVVGAVVPLIVVFIFGAAYGPAIAITIGLLPGVFFLGVASVTSQFLSAHGYPWSQVLSWIFGSLLQLALSLALFGQVGSVGLAWIQSGCAAIVCALLLVNSWQFSARDSIADGK